MTPDPLKNSETPIAPVVLIIPPVPTPLPDEPATLAAVAASHSEHFRLLVESTRDYAMFTLDTQGRVDSWNAGAEHVLGYTEEEALGQPAALIFTPEDRAEGRPEQEMQEALSTGRALDERLHLKKNGTRFRASGVMAPLTDRAGTVVGFAKILWDLTERRQHEKSLERANGQLESRVTERTRELTTSMDERRELLRRVVNAQEAERAHISRELHDVIGQTITALSLGLGGLKSTANLPTSVLEAVTMLHALVQELAEQTHRMSTALRPTVLDDLGLSMALENHVTNWCQWNRLFVDLQRVGLDGPRLPGEIETTIYRMVQEALTNISRHARGAGGASKVSILVQRGPGHVQTVVEDDGPGFAMAALRNAPLSERRLGLFGMQERAALVGGTLSIESAPGKGTTLLLRIPLPKTAA